MSRRIEQRGTDGIIGIDGTDGVIAVGNIDTFSPKKLLSIELFPALKSPTTGIRIS